MSVKREDVYIVWVLSVRPLEYRDRNYSQTVQVIVFTFGILIIVVCRCHKEEVILYVDFVSSFDDLQLECLQWIGISLSQLRTYCLMA